MHLKIFQKSNCLFLDLCVVSHAGLTLYSILSYNFQYFIDFSHVHVKIYKNEEKKSVGFLENPQMHSLFPSTTVVEHIVQSQVVCSGSTSRYLSSGLYSLHALFHVFLLCLIKIYVTTSVELLPFQYTQQPCNSRERLLVL